jgi:hypothetical protein
MVSPIRIGPEEINRLIEQQDIRRLLLTHSFDL